MNGRNGRRRAIVFALCGAALLWTDLGTARGASAGTTAGSGGGTVQATAAADLCKVFSSQLPGAQAQAVLAWASRKLSASCADPGIPPTGEDCVSQSYYFQACVDCCVYDGQVSQECSSKCFEAFPIYPITPVPYPQEPVTPEEKCCRRWCGSDQQGFGLSGCCGGKVLSCNCVPGMVPDAQHPGLGPILQHIKFCTDECEGQHQKNYTCAPGNPNQIWNDPLCGSPCSECEVNRCFASCVDTLDCPTSADPAACQAIQQEIRANRDQYCKECTKCRETHK